MSHAADASHEGINLFLGIIEGERGTDGTGDAKTIHQGLGTVMTSTDGNAEIARLLPGISTQDAMQFYQQHIAKNQNRVWIIIGDKKLTDMKALTRYGKIVELKKEEIYR